MSTFREQRLKGKMDDLQSRYQRLDEKLKLVTNDYDNETRSEEKLRIRAIIDDTEKEMKKVGEEIDALEAELDQLGAPVKTAANPSSAPTVISATSSIQSSDSQTSAQPIKVFYSYAHEDEDLRDKLNTHLKILVRQNIISEWYDRDIQVGDEWAEDIKKNLESAQIILLLISADFIASDYCWGVELKHAMERHNAGKARVIPIILRKCDWTEAPFGKLQALPKNARPVMSSADKDEAFTDIARGIRRAAEGMRQS